MTTDLQLMAAAVRPKNPSKARKRAPKACLSCRARKVRCDVSQRGRPCMNCYLDSESCVVTGRASRLRKTQKPAATATTAPATAHPATDAANDAAEEPQTAYLSPDFVSGDDLHLQQTQEAASTMHDGHHCHDHDSHGHDHHDHADQHGTPPSPESADGTVHKTEARSTPGSTLHYNAPEGSTHSPDHRDKPSNKSDNRNRRDQSTRGDSAATLGLHTPVGLDGMQWSSQNNSSNNAGPRAADITFSYYPFLAVSNLSGLLPQDVNYLESQGCLRVPTRALLDEFVQQYFLHVHPLLPLFSEGDFWEVYCQQDTAGVPSCGRFSLLVFQAMLFSTCNFVSRSSIHALGFPTIRLARAAIYRRAKLLFDFETEASPAAIAQAALLLSFWSRPNSSGVKTPNTAWLCTAILQARLAEAQHYASFTDPRDARRANALKRLWWCCIVRDRTLGLGVRRSLHITRTHFDFDANEPLTCADLADEIERSRVYNPGTKSCLIEIFVNMVKLCIVQTDILTLVFPLDDTPGWGHHISDSDYGRVQQSKDALRSWYKDTTLRISGFSSVGAGRTGSGTSRLAAVSSGSGREFCHDSIILYTNLMYMYYHSTRVALSHHEVLRVAVANAHNPGGVHDNPKAISILYASRFELQDATFGVTECLKELIQLRLARWLPISAVTCTALPLFLHIIDAKLSISVAAVSTSPKNGSAAGKPASSVSSALKQHRLNILIEAMKTYQPQYDGVDWISETIRHIVNLAEIDGPGKAGITGKTKGCGNGSTTGIADWTDMLASNPSWYLRLALTMDMALSKNRMPEERDFPTSLRSLFSNGITAKGQAAAGVSGTTNGSIGNAGNTASLDTDMTADGATPSMDFAFGVGTSSSALDDTGLIVAAGSGDARAGHVTTFQGATANGVPKENHAGDYGYSSAYEMNPHHLAMSMGVAMGMDLDLDLIDMDLDLGFSPLPTPDMETQLLASDNGLSELSPPVSATTETTDQNDQNSLQGGSSTAISSASPPATSLDALDCSFGEHASASRNPGKTQVPDANRPQMTIAATGEVEDEHDWVEQSWEDHGGELRESDRDTARALLEAMDDA